MYTPELIISSYLFFFLFSLGAIISSFIAITTNSSIYSVFYLILVFFNAAGLLIMLGAEFLAMLFLVVYLGAIAILFLFVIMMLNIKINQFKNKIILGAQVFFITLLFSLIYINIPHNSFINLSEILTFNDSEKLILFLNNYSIQLNNLFYNINSFNYITNSHQFFIVYTQYAYYFLLSALILLVSLIGAIVLTLHKKINVKKQDLNKQINRNFQTTIKTV
uniref:NADH-ubiquinone oxidoreductase chain 6 n=1 Tax=Cyanophora paradoxa TaxID=2762 RepID=E9P1D0_CYAPA|nr:NADH dehydrogenase subunit 6 [Cyanophora paradoxa]ADW79182.1 NADH dehydrogenase subunit 6 [Cyanophora paradoxa]